MRRTASLCAAALTMASAACTSSPAPDTSGAGVPSAPAASGTPGPAASGRWSGLRAECPQLTSVPGQAVAAAGAGQRQAPSTDGSLLLNAKCGYGVAEGSSGLALTVTVMVFRRDTTDETVVMAASRALGTARSSVLDGRRGGELPAIVNVSGIGDSAFAVQYVQAGSATLHAASSNAYLNLQYWYPQRDRNDTAKNREDAEARLAELRTLAADTLDDLR